MTSIATVAALIADPARAAMLQALMAGQALTAGELARAAGIAPSTASGHIAKLADGGLARISVQGRHRYVSLAGEQAAQLLESLMAMTEPPRAWKHGEALRRARTCYDHLAGRLGVALRQSLASRGWIRPDEGGWSLSDIGANQLEAAGVDLVEATRRKRFACDCMDWSERTPHLSGGLATAICALCMKKGFVHRLGDEGLARRTLAITPEGSRVLRETFGVSLAA